MRVADVHPSDCSVGATETTKSERQRDIGMRWAPKWAKPGGSFAGFVTPGPVDSFSGWLGSLSHSLKPLRHRSSNLDPVEPIPYWGLEAISSLVRRA